MTTPRINPQAAAPVHECDERCGCGNLLARRTKRGLEIKCRRCKRVYVIDVAEGDFASRPLPQ
jgi:hypothetical protein